VSNRINEIIKIINNPEIKCVSFDLFDTLVQRPVIDPSDLFTLVGFKVGDMKFFKQRRQAAERHANLFKDFYKACVDIDDIYKSYQVMFGTNMLETERIKQCELEVEYDLIYTRQSVKKIYNFAKMKGKKIIITSDMYLSSDFLKKVLEKNGYEKNSKLYISCEENSTKRSGTLYDKIIMELEEEGIWSENILHIGDNQKDDVEVAVKKGITAIHIPKASDVFKDCPRLKRILTWRMPVYEGTHTLMIGLLANMLFDDPFIEFDKDSRYSGEARFLGLYLAPFFMNFTLWLAEQTRQDNINTLVLIWRDGYLFEKMLEIIEPYLSYKLPVRQRAYLSRAVRYPFYSLEKGGLFDSFCQWILDPQTTVMQFIERYLMLTTEEDINAALAIFVKYGYTSKYQELGKAENYNWFAYEFEPLFQKGSEEHRNLLVKHIAFMKSVGKVGIFDIGYRGTTARFLNNYHGIDSIGYHILGTMGINESHDGCDLKAFIEYGNSTIINTKSMLHKFLELVISEQTPSVVGFKEKTPEEIAYLTDDNFDIDERIITLQQGILEYAEKFTELFANYIDILSIDSQLLWTMVTSILSGTPNKKDADLIRTMNINISYFSGRTESFQDWYNKIFPAEQKGVSAKKGE